MDTKNGVKRHGCSFDLSLSLSLSEIVNPIPRGDFIISQSWK